MNKLDKAIVRSLVLVTLTMLVASIFLISTVYNFTCFYHGEEHIWLYYTMLSFSVCVIFFIFSIKAMKKLAFLVHLLSWGFEYKEQDKKLEVKE